MLGEEEIENRFGLHKAAIEGPNATIEIHKDLRHAFKMFARILDEIIPEEQPAAKRYKVLMFDDLERASMWSHKGVAQISPLIDE